MAKGDTTTTSTPAATSAVAQSVGGGAEPPSPPAADAGEPGAPFELGTGFDGDHSLSRSYARGRDDPIYRPLKIYTVDPVRARLEGAVATINIPYERLEKGPRGARFEVVQVDDGPFRTYDPVDLEDPHILIRSGREPAPSDRVFHHQMVYAVACSTYAAFRTALGREITWSFGDPRLKLVPHGAFHREAAYSSQRQEVWFGWYDAGSKVAGRVPPGGRVYLCLSHDVIAHEVTHALLDGLRAQFNAKAHKEVDAFHEAFADLVALLQRFSYSEVVKEAIRRTAGAYHTDPSFLRFGFQLAQSEDKRVEREPDFEDPVQQFDLELDGYSLGTVLLSAILEAMIRVYDRKSEPLYRLASGGSGLFQKGAALPEDLVEALTHIASRLASQFLSICIRAIDYCPPVGLDFGEYLRALITADFELVPDDPWGYRQALIDAFIRRRIYPRGAASLSEDALLWRAPTIPLHEPRLNFAELRFAGDPASPASREELRRQAGILGSFVTRDAATRREFGLALNGDPRLNGDTVGLPTVESIRSSRRIGPDGQVVFDLIAEVIQLRRVNRGPGMPEMDFYAGSTIIFGPEGDVRYVISKSVTDQSQLDRLAIHRDENVVYVEP